ncbi:stress response protein NST1-like [Centruroides sculpturatus]|uniref:stress response protein NST1-like n=1 Tax=Centruroides sculpturatus TaxID=218467 RepID=UPI000C6CB2A3|nr:stress response protein NST1-like [Centruroides sculpturatus]
MVIEERSSIVVTSNTKKYTKFEDCNLTDICELFPYRDNIDDDEDQTEKCRDSKQTGEAKKYINTRNIFSTDITKCGRILKIIKNNENVNNLKDITERLYREFLDILELECRKTIESTSAELRKEIEKWKTDDADEAIKKLTREHNNYVKRLQKEHKKKLQQEVIKIEIGTKHELEVRVEEEKRSSERRIRAAMEEAAGHFEYHLKTAIGEIRKEERKINEERYEIIKKDLEKKLRDKIRTSAEYKKKLLCRTERRIRKETEERVQKWRKEEELESRSKLNLQKERYESRVNKLRRKLRGMESGTTNLTQRLKEAIIERTEAETEMVKMKEYLGQFIKLANQTQADSLGIINVTPTESGGPT